MLSPNGAYQNCLGTVSSNDMSSAMLHPVILVALEPQRSFPRAGQVAGMMGLVMAMVILGLVIS